MFSKWFKFSKKSKYNSVLQKMNLFTMLEIKHVFSSDMTILSITPVYSKISTYNSRIKYFIDCLKTNSIINNNLLSSSSKVNLIEFYTDEQNNFLDIKKSTEMFINLSKEFIMLLDKLDQKESRNFNENRNFNHCEIIINNIDLLISELTELLKK